MKINKFYNKFFAAFIIFCASVATLMAQTRSNVVVEVDNVSDLTTLTGSKPVVFVRADKTTRVNINGVWEIVSGTSGATGSVTEKSISNFSGNIDAAKTSIGSVKTTLIIDVDTPISVATIIPPNITFRRVNTGKFTKSSSGSINFQGSGIDNPTSSEPLFYNFNAGDITFSGTDYPRYLSSDLWTAASLSEKLNKAIASITNKPVEILATPGTLTSKVEVTTKKTISFAAGDYDNTVPDYPQFKMFDQTALLGVKGLTRLKESSVAGNVRFVYGSGIFNGTLDGKNYDITVDGITFSGNAGQTLDTAAGTVFLGNVTNGRITNNTFDGTHGFGAYVGAFGTAGNYAENCLITDNIFRHLGTQHFGVISGKNITLARNIVSDVGLPSGGTASIAVVDIEPNSSDDRIDGLQIIDNVINIKGANASTVCIIAQSSDAPAMTGIRIAGNQCIGLDISNTFGGVRAMSVGINVSGALYPIVENNYTVGGGQTGFEIDNSYGAIARNNTVLSHGGGGNSAVGLYACAKCKVISNDIETTLIPISQAADIRETEKTQTVNVTSGNALISSTGALVYKWWVGEKIVWNGVEYTVVTAPTNRTYTVSPTPTTSGTFTATTKFSSSQYIHNITSGITLAPNSQSLIYSLVADASTPSVSPSPSPSPDVVLYRINCGGEAVGGWVDSNFVATGTQTADYGTTNDLNLIPAVQPPNRVFQTIRYDSAVYNLPVTDAGNYKIELFFTSRNSSLGDANQYAINDQSPAVVFYPADETGGSFRGLVKTTTVSMGANSTIKIQANSISGIRLTKIGS